MGGTIIPKASRRRWCAPARLYMNVERAYREFRSEPPDAPRDTAATFNAIYQVAKAKGIEVEF
jgi:cyclase